MHNSYTVSYGVSRFSLVACFLTFEVHFKGMLRTRLGDGGGVPVDYVGVQFNLFGMIC